MDERFQNALLNSISRQRNAALDSAAQLEASLGIFAGENADLKAKIADLNSQLSARPPAPALIADAPLPDLPAA